MELDDRERKAIALLDEAMSAKQMLVAQEGVGSDLLPTLVLMQAGRLLGAVEVHGGPAIMAARVSSAIALTNADTVGYISEAYGVREDVFQAQPGCAEECCCLQHLAERFALGDEAVVETIDVRIQDDAAHVVALCAPYTYKGRKVVFAAAQGVSGTMDDDADADLIGAAIRHGFQKRAEAPDMDVKGAAQMLDMPCADRGELLDEQAKREQARNN